MAVPHFKHLLLTRFNLDYGEADYICDEEWHRHRFELFHQYTLPSVQKQKSDNFEWILFFNEQLKDQYQAEINKISEHFSRIVFLFIKPGADHVGILRQYIQLNYSHSVIITTRMDNDDVIADSFIESIQQRCKEIEQTGKTENYLINCGNGYQAELGFPFRKSVINGYRHSPFLSLVSRKDGDGVHSTIIDKPHHLWGSDVDTIELEPALWVQLIHDRNLANRVVSLQLVRKLPSDSFPETLKQSMIQRWFLTFFLPVQFCITIIQRARKKIWH